MEVEFTNDKINLRVFDLQNKFFKGKSEGKDFSLSDVSVEILKEYFKQNPTRRYKITEAQSISLPTDESSKKISALAFSTSVGLFGLRIN